MNIFYAPSATIGSLITLDENESTHCTRVLRLKAGEDITVMNGNGGLFTGQIVDPHPKRCTVSITEGTTHSVASPRIHIAIAPTKAIDRFEWFVEKSIEIGVSEITPLLCQKSERKQINDERMDRLVVSAMKQSMQLYKTKVNPLTKLSDVVKKCCESQKLIAHCEPQEKLLLKTACKPGVDTLVLIGPEGDFSVEEIAFALKNEFKAISLGDSRLRTETAGLVACHSVMFINQK